MKKYAYKCRLFLIAIVLLFVCVTFAVIGSISAPSTTVAYAAEGVESGLAVKETATDNVEYAPLERVNYVNTSACRVINPEPDTFAGVVGKNATRKTNDSQNKAYQLYFDNCFEIKKQYEISFYAKTVSAAHDFYVKVWYASDGNLTKNEDLPKLETVNGEWTKYSFTFTSDQNLNKCFKLTLEPKNSFEEIYYDQFSAVLVEDGYQPYLCGEQFTSADWTSGVDAESVTSFNGENYPAGVKMTAGSLTSKIFETPVSGIFRLRFAMQKTAGASVSLSIRNAVGEVVEEIALGSVEFAYYDIATSNLTGNAYMILQFDVVCDAETDYAFIGALEMVAHTHDTSLQPSGYPIRDFTNCKTTYKCKICELELVTYNHDFKVEKEATCATNGAKVCQNQECGLKVTLPATGKHVYEDVQCSAENAGMALNCLICGGGRIRLPEEHDLVCVSTSPTEHQFICSVCSYQDTPTKHSVDNVEIAKTPTATEKGYAVTDCDVCKQKHGKELPSLEGDGAAYWVKSVILQESCVQTGIIRYTLTDLEEIYIEIETEAWGHTYEAIKKMPTCTEDGISLHHKCVTCGYVKETEAEIKVLSAYGHELLAWAVEKSPTLETEGLRKRYCTRCQELVEEQTIPKLDEVNYTKYALDDHNEKKGFYYYYESEEWGTYKVYVKGVDKDAKTVLIICVSCAVVLVGSVSVCFIVATNTKKKKE